jgi:hypothetical protein
MKYIFFIICSIILPIISVKVTKPKLCINCKHFITDNNTGLFGKCSLFPLKEGEINFLVNGINEEKYSYCTTSRSFDNMCGVEGKKYKKKYSKIEREKSEEQSGN